MDGWYPFPPAHNPTVYEVIVPLAQLVIVLLYLSQPISQFLTQNVMLVDQIDCGNQSYIHWLGRL